MIHGDKRNVLDHVENETEVKKNILQQLIDAKSEIAELKMKIAWLECSYE